MMWTVTSGRLRWAEGTRLSEDDLAGCNIEALVAGGHLSAASDNYKALVAGGHLSAASDNYKKRQPVAPVPDMTADEPKEQD
jgi:hypothetical protein